MMERIKTITLALLVTSSLVFSYFLAYSSPKFETVTQTDYVESEVIGTQAELADVLLPAQVILHFGDGTHTLLPLNQQFYRMIYNDFLKQRTLDGLKQTSMSALDINWEETRNQAPGIELRFAEGIPLHVLQNIMQIKVDPGQQDDVITKLWIYVNYVNDNTEDVRTFLFTDKNTTIYEVTRPNISAKDVENLVALGKYLTPYQSYTGDYYLPEQPVTMAKLTLPFSEFTPDQLKRSLFVDPSMTFYITKRDGSQIYTDGKKVLQIASDKHWISYSDPISVPIDSKNDLKENLLSSIQFINQHGGWNGNYIYSNKSGLNQDTSPQTFEFRQYVNDYPIFGLKTDNFGFIKIILQKGVISGYERSMLNLDSSQIVRTDASLPGGKELNALLDSYPKKADIVSVFAGYQEMVIAGSKVDLVPRWIVRLRDGSSDFL